MRSLSRQPEPHALRARLRGVAVLPALAVLLLASCTGARDNGNELSVRSASITPTESGPVLQLSLDCQLGDTLRDALDHGIPLTFAVRLRSDDGAVESTRRVEMRYFPLSRRYVLRDRDRSDIIRSAVAPAYLVDAMTALRIVLDHRMSKTHLDQRWQVDVRLERDALPGALRLPAMLSRDWRLRTKEFEWNAGAG